MRIQRQIAFASGIFQEDVTIRTLLESLAEGIVIIDSSGTILLVNTAAEKMFGYQKKDLIGKPHIILIPERYRSIHEEHEADYFKEPRIRPMGQMLDLAGRRRDGSDFPVEISLGFIDTMHGVLVLALVSDMTLRKQFETRLRETEQRFASFMRHLPAAAWMKNLDGRYVYANAEAERVFSVPLPQLLGKTDDELFPPETARQFRENDQLVKAEDGNIQTTEALLQADGIEHHSMVTKFAVPGLDGRTEYVAGVGFDITDLIRAEEALRNSEARFRALYRDNPTMIAILDAELTMLSVNQSCASQLGYPADELEGQSVLKLFHEDDRPAVAEQMRKCLESPGQVHNWQFRKVRKDGCVLWVEEVAQAVHELNGVLNILVVCQDITERKRAEDALRDSEERFRALMTASSQVLYRMSPDWSEMRQLYSREFLASTETPNDTWLQKYIHPDDQPHVTAVIREAIRTKSIFELEHRILRADGTLGWTLSRAIPLLDANGEIVEWFGAASDITERKLAEEALQKSEEKFSMIFNMAPVGITISTIEDGRFVDVNAAAEQFSGYRRDEVIGRTAMEFDIWKDPQDRAETVEAVLKKGEVRDRQMLMKDKGGNLFWGSYSAVAVELKGEKYLLSLVRDITDRKLAEEEIEKLNADLTARAVELEAFNYTVAHDLRQPLNIISSYCQLIEELCGDKLDEQCLGYLRETYSGTLRMNSLIAALLNFSRMARVEVHPEEVNLSAMAHAVAVELKLAEPERRVDLRISDGMKGYCDANLLRVLLDNLMGNAWKYTRMRDVGVIEFGVMLIDGEQVYFVRDNGPGFAMADADRLFIPFQRLPGAEEYRGFGIGLATSERIIRRHGGKIWAGGEPDKGATFYFTLPTGTVSS